MKNDPQRGRCTARRQSPEPDQSNPTPSSRQRKRMERIDERIQSLVTQMVASTSARKSFTSLALARTARLLFAVHQPRSDCCAQRANRGERHRNLRPGAGRKCQPPKSSTIRVIIRPSGKAQRRPQRTSTVAGSKSAECRFARKRTPDRSSLPAVKPEHAG
jgi:hypothetical protein